MMLISWDREPRTLHERAAAAAGWLAVILLAIFLTLVLRRAVHAAACLPPGAPCGQSAPAGGVCCIGEACHLFPDGHRACTGGTTTTTTSTTSSTSAPAETTTTSTTTPADASTTTTETGPEPTTTSTTLVPPTNEFSFLFTPYDLRPTAAEPPGFTGNFLDPRTGLVANQFLMATMSWQLEAYSMELVAMADAAGCRFNEGQITNANFKFGGDYVLNHSAFPSGGAYHWLHPPYIRQYTLEPIVDTAPCLQDHGVLTPNLAQLAGLLQGVASPPPAVSNATFQGGTSYQLGHYVPLTAVQCAALQAADDAHMAHDKALLAHDLEAAAANNAAVKATQRAFEATATDYDQATLFKWEWQANYNRGNPQDVLDSLTQKIIDAHHQVLLAYHCATHQPPDAAKILHYEIKHNFLHDCRATTHWLDRPVQTVCEDNQISSCPHLTCREQAAR
jgi:hypothetical protein